MQFSISRPASLLALSAALFLGLAAVLIPPRVQGQSPSPGSAIVDTALSYVGTWQGECWPWVRQVVAEATGNQMGFGYHAGFIEGGAVEVSMSEAQPGDVIQMADPSNNGPGVDYIGLHTAIVYIVHGDGTFTVIDSNSQWDGMVRIRPNYDPAWAAGRYAHISPRVYRFGSAGNADPAVPPPSDTPPAPTLDFGLHDTVRIDTPGSCLNIRSSAGGSVIRCLAHGTLLTVVSEPVTSGQHTWVQVETEDGERGWVAAQFVHLIETSVPGSSDLPADTAPGSADTDDPESIDRSTLTHRVVAPGIATDE